MIRPATIIDSHHHLWNPDTNTPDIGYVWLKNIGAMKPFGDPTPIQRDYLLDEFLGEHSKPNIVGSVHLQCDGAVPNPVAETAFIQNTCDKANHPVRIVGFVDLAADNAEAVILSHKKHSSFIGVRQILSRLDDQPKLCFAGEHYLHNTKWCRQFTLLKEHNLSFDAQLYPEQMNDAAALFAQHSDVSVIIDHAGSPHDQTPKGLQTWQQGISALAALPQCAIKLCGFGMFDHKWSENSIRPMVEHIYEAFGAERVMFGSNYPVDKLMRSYDELVKDITAIVEPYGQNAIDALFTENAQKYYRF